jgi:hypothetical protein
MVTGDMETPQVGLNADHKIVRRGLERKGFGQTLAVCQPGWTDKAKRGHNVSILLRPEGTAGNDVRGALRRLMWAELGNGWFVR